LFTTQALWEESIANNIGGWSDYKYKGCDDLKGSRLDDYNMIPTCEKYDKEYLDKAENDVVQGLKRLMVVR
jgi:hypothetical protein